MYACPFLDPDCRQRLLLNHRARRSHQLCIWDRRLRPTYQLRNRCHVTVDQHPRLVSDFAVANRSLLQLDRVAGDKRDPSNSSFEMQQDRIQPYKRVHLPATPSRKKLADDPELSLLWKHPGASELKTVHDMKYPLHKCMVGRPANHFPSLRVDTVWPPVLRTCRRD